MKVKLEDIYLNPEEPAGFGGIDRLWQSGKVIDPNLRRDEVKEWLTKWDPYTLYRQNRRRFPRLQIKVKGPRRILSVDLADFQQLAKHNNGYRFAIVAVDAFSRYGWLIPIRQKTGNEVARALEEHIFQDTRYPLLHVDKGAEFYNKHVTTMLRRYNSKLYSTYSPDTKAAHAERLIRTIKGRLYPWMNHANSWKWTVVAAKVIKAYNNTPHRAFKGKFTPNQIHQDPPPLPVAEIKEMLYGEKPISPRSSEYKVGDTVRISQLRFIYHHGYYPQNSEEIFRIQKVDSSDQITTYQLEDLKGEPILGRFYNDELIRTAEKEYYKVDKILKERGVGRKKEYFVSFQGYPASANAWIKASNLKPT